MVSSPALLYSSAFGVVCLFTIVSVYCVENSLAAPTVSHQPMNPRPYYPLKRSFDSLTGSGFSGFDKRAFDSFTGSGFTGMDKRLFDSLVGHGFTGLDKRSFDALTGRGFTGFDKRAFDSLTDIGFTGFD